MHRLFQKMDIDKEKAESLKNKGNDEFKKANYEDAIDYYTSAIGITCINTLNIEINDQEAAYFGNRAASFLALER